MHQLRRRFRRRSDDFETVELRVQMISPRASKNYRDTDQHGSLPTISAHMEVGKGPCRLESGCDHSAIQGKGSRTICSSYTAISAGQGLRPCALRTSAAPSHTSAETAEIWFYAQSFDNIPHTGVASPGWAASWISKTVACGLHWYQGCLQFGGPPGTVESISCHRSSTIPDSAHPHGTTSRVRVGWKLSKAFNTSSSVRQGCVLAPALLLSGNWLDHVQMFGQSWRYSRWSSVHRPQLCRRKVALRTRSRKVAGRTQTFRRCCNHHEPSHLVGKDKTAEHRSRSSSSISLCWRTPCGGQWEVCLSGQHCWLHWIFQYWYSSTTRPCNFSDGPVRPSLAPELAESRHQAENTTSVLAVGIYGAETWTMLKEDSRTLHAFHMTCQRRIMNIRWNYFITNRAVADRMNLPSILSTIAARCHSIFGHIRRQSDSTHQHTSRWSSPWMPGPATLHITAEIVQLADHGLHGLARSSLPLRPLLEPPHCHCFCRTYMCRCSDHWQLKLSSNKCRVMHVNR